MLQESRSVFINRPIDEVFAYVVDPRNNAMWNGWVIESIVTEGGPPAVGTTFKSKVKFLGRTIDSDAVITELIPNERGTIKTTTGPITAMGSRIVEAVDGGTRFTQTMEADFRGTFGSIAESVVIRTALRQFETDLETLKDLLESRVPTEAVSV